MNEQTTENQVVGEVTLDEAFTKPIQIVETPEEKAERLRVANLQYRLIIAQARLGKRQTTKLSRLASLLSRVNGLRRKLNMKELTLKEFREGVR